MGVIITFKRSEDAAVIRFLRDHEDCPDEGPFGIDEDDPPGLERIANLYPLPQTSEAFALERVGTPVRPSWEELERNRRARSATVHCMQKVPRLSPCVPASSSRRKLPHRDPWVIMSEVSD